MTDKRLSGFKFEGVVKLCTDCVQIVYRLCTIILSSGLWKVGV